MWQGHRVSVVFPAYNEQEGIAEAVADFGTLDAVDEVVVADPVARRVRVRQLGEGRYDETGRSDLLDVTADTLTTRLVWPAEGTSPGP